MQWVNYKYDVVINMHLKQINLFSTLLVLNNFKLTNMHKNKC